MKNSKTHSMQRLAKKMTGMAIRDDDGKYAPVNVGFDSKYGSKESDKAAWYRVGDSLGLEGTDCFPYPAGFASLPAEEQIARVKSIVTF